MGYSPLKCICNAPKETHIQENAFSYLNVYMTNSDPEFSPTLSHSSKPRMSIIILLVDNPPMFIYQLGRLRRLIYYLFVDYPPMNINWAVSDD